VVGVSTWRMAADAAQIVEVRGVAHGAVGEGGAGGRGADVGGDHACLRIAALFPRQVENHAAKVGRRSVDGGAM